MWNTRCREKPMVSRWFWTVILIFLKNILFNGFSLNKLFEFALMEMLGGSFSWRPTDLKGKSAMWCDLQRAWTKSMSQMVGLITLVSAKLIQIPLVPFLRFLKPWMVAGGKRIAALNRGIRLICTWSVIACYCWLKTTHTYNVVDYTQQIL